MIEDLATYLFILCVALTGVFYALLPARSTTIVRGRLLNSWKDQNDLVVQVEVAGRAAERVGVDPYGHFRCTVSASQPAVLRVVHRSTVVHRIQLTPNTSARGSALPAPTSIDLGDIVVEGSEGLDQRTSVLLHPEWITLSCSSTDRLRYAPLEHQLFDRAGAWHFNEEVDPFRVGNRPSSTQEYQMHPNAPDPASGTE